MRSRKRPYMYALILTASDAGGGGSTQAGPELRPVAGSVGGVVALAVVIAILNFYWLYAIYYVTLCLFSLLAGAPPPRAAAPMAPGRSPKVAVLYLTKNDFAEASIESCLRQDFYPELRGLRPRRRRLPRAGPRRDGATPSSRAATTCACVWFAASAAAASLAA